MSTAIRSRWTGWKPQFCPCFLIVLLGLVLFSLDGIAPVVVQQDAESDAIQAAAGEPVTDAASEAEIADEPPAESDAVETTAAESSVPLGEVTHSDVRTSSFQEITPGKTTVAELRQRMGEPADDQQGDRDRVLTYQLGPFPRVEMIVIGEIVDSVVVYLGEAARPQDIASELGLNDFTPAVILGESGEQLGLVYPERGVAFSLDSTTLPPRVSQLVLSPISAEFFVLRALNSRDTDYERNLADANYALRLAPNNATAYWLKAQILAKAGLYEGALTAAEGALNLQPRKPEFRLTWALIKTGLGNYRQALAETEALLSEDRLPLLLQARAEALLGDLTADGPDHDHELAMEHHIRAVELAAPLASSLKPGVRREAREFLVEVHLSVANDITRGDWESKREAAPKWLRSARALADKLLAEDDGDERVRLLLLQKALACYVGMKGAVDPSGVIHQALQTSQKLTNAAQDVYRRREIEWMLVESLTDAVRIEQLRGQPVKVEDYASRAVEILNRLATTEDTADRSDLRIGRLYFYVGSTFAIRDDDHQQAVRWYEKAQPFLARIRLSRDSVDLGRQGQRFVSMGVSYWEAEVPDEAIRLTESGLDLMLLATEAGTLNPSALAIPYGNLAAMYQAVGRGEEAEQLAAKAELLEDDTTRR